MCARATDVEDVRCQTRESVSRAVRRSIVVLLVQPWTEDAGPVETALRARNLDPVIRRADFEAAVHAALAREYIDVIVLDPGTPGMTEDGLRRACAAMDLDVPVVTLDSLATVADAVRAVLEPLRN